MIIISVTDFLVFFLLTSFGMYPPVVQVTSLFFGIVCFVGYKVIYVRESWTTIFPNSDKIFQLAVISAVLVAMRGALINIAGPLFTSHPIFSFLPAMAITVAVGLLIHRQTSFSEKLLSLGVGLLIVKLFHLGTIELLPEEGYYWNYAINPAFGYIDHPPMVGWIIAIGTSIFGVNEFGVRISAYIISLLTIAAVAVFHKRMFGKEGVLITIAICLLAPYLSGVGLFTSPDTMLVLAWILAIYNLYIVLLEGTSNRWYWVGLWVGIGMLSKYTIVLLALPTVVFCLLDQKNRYWFRKKEPYIALLIAIVVFSPVIFWNMFNSWASFAFQSSSRVAQASHKFSLHGLMFDMAILYLPSTLIILFKLLPFLRSPKASDEKFQPDDSKRKFIFSALFFLLPASVFIIYSFKHETKLNWTGPAFLTMLPWVGYWLSTRATEIYKKSTLIVSSAFVFLVAIIFQYLSFGLPLIPYSQSMHRILGWKSMSQAVLAQANNMLVVDGKAPVIAGMDKHFISSNLSFYAQSLNSNKAKWGGFDFASRNLLGEDALMWSRWSDALSLKGRTVLMVAKNPNDLSDERLTSRFTSLEPLKQLDLKTRDKVTRTYYTRIGRDLKSE